ncbi:MAG: GAF domain-containing protein [Anaerolineae bacterium]|nr:GAF domain-containing protein [Anaerolineae bacterium]
MGKLLDNWFKISRYSSSLDRARARAVLHLMLMALLLYTAFIIERDFWPDVVRGTVWTFSIPAFYLIWLITLVWLRMGWLSVAEVGPLIITLIGTVPSSIQTGMVDPDDVVLLGVFIMMAGLFKRRSGLLAGFLVAILLLAVGIGQRGTILDIQPQFTSERNLSDFLTISIELMAVAGLVLIFLAFIRLSREEGEASVQAKRITMAEITSNITRQISHQLSLQETMDQAVELIAAGFPDVYHAQVFLLNESSSQAELLASTGEVGKLLKQRRHSLKVGGRSVIGQVTGKAEAVIAIADAPDSIHRHNDLLPNTAVEAAFPMRVGDRLIGALDLQSRNPGAFAESDLPTFQTLTDHIAIAVENARLFDEANETIRQNRLLLEQTRSNTEEVGRLNRQLTRQMWADHLRGKNEEMALNIDFGASTTERGGAWTHTLKEAIRSNQTVQQQENGRQIIAVPVRVRGEVIGAMEFELDETGNLSPDDMHMVEKISEQLGLAAENTRLYENTQRLAHREVLVNQIAARIQETNQIDATLTVAARSLKEILRAGKVAIRLGSPPVTNPKQSGGES